MKEKILQFFKDFIKSRNVLFYVALGIAVLAFIFGIVATAGLSEAGCGALPIVFTLLGLLAFIGFSLVGHEWAGAGAAGIGCFMSIVAVLCNVYSYYLTQVQDLAMIGINAKTVLGIPGMGVLITSLVAFLLCAVTFNVFAWLRLRKKTAKASAASDTDGEELDPAADGVNETPVNGETNGEDK